ncbi:ABC transporter permease [Cryobacterium suzukii]|uniref:ABC transporter permease n=2 Tax=Cryobacterium suzukii TaxID=1259198 RepID=A0A4R9AEN4_9MICO|nr:ABC transporter permease [Cryobacterium suzukii]
MITAKPKAASSTPRPRWQRVARRFARRPMAVTGLILVVGFVLFAILGPILLTDPNQQDFTAILQTPSFAHLLGTDDLGRDVFARIANGARVSLMAGVMSTALALIIGITIGLITGFYRGWVDVVVMRIVDVMLAFPFLIFAVGLAAILGASLTNVIIALAVSQVPEVIRIARGEAMAIREQEFVSGAVADGARDGTIMFRYIAPNAMSAFIVQATVAIPAAIIGESTLSFLGLGVQPPMSSWGIMLTSAQQYLAQAPYLALFPGIAIALTALGFNLLGDGLRDVLDPKETR